MNIFFLTISIICLSVALVNSTDVINSLANGIPINSNSNSALIRNEKTTLNTRNVQALCPNMFHHVFSGYVPRDGTEAGNMTDLKFDGAVNLYNCVLACCEKKNHTCNVAFVYKQTCYHVRCNSNVACLPKERGDAKGPLEMVLVDPVAGQPGDEETTWMDVLKAEKLSEFISAEEAVASPLNFWKSNKFRYESPPPVYEDEYIPMEEKRVKQLFMNRKNDMYANSAMDDEADDEVLFYSGSPKYIPCDPAIDGGCPEKEVCVGLRPGDRKGICKCMLGYARNRLRDCVLRDIDFGGDKIVEKIFQSEGGPRHISLLESIPVTERQMNDGGAAAAASKEEQQTKIAVSVMSKEVQLPEKEVTLSAYTVPDEQSSGVPYKYLWTLITQPKGPMNGTISDQTKSKVKLSNLSEGLYTFKVSVTGNGTYGDAMANVTVFPEKRINRLPQVVISPSVQTIKWPTTNAILDGSASTDDDKIIGWHWELKSGPIGYEPNLPEINTLQLSDLTSPGNYTFQLTVTDSDNAKNFTTANITVLKVTDYPPEANAGSAVMVYLPHNNVTLNGTASTDDREIVAWEWTKDASDESKAVDMQNTRTPYLQLSNLEEGMYTFVLKVTDGSNQSSTAKVPVFVKPATNSPPVAEAGTNSTINLPKNWAELNGSQSKDDIKITSYRWSQVSGPKDGVIVNSNESVANATSLTIGLYEFKLTVYDENNNTASDSTWVKVVQEKNTAPVANAGGDQSITLPVSVIYLNGSKSYDDLNVVNYSWTRDDMSLAAGNIVGNTNHEPVLMLTDVAHGRYIFKLTVNDEQGLTGTDTVSVIVRPDPKLLNLVELTFSMGISVLTQSELDSMVQKIALLLGNVKIYVRKLKIDSKSDEAILVFYAEELPPAGTTDIKPTPIPGLRVEQILKEKILRDSSILGAAFADVRTTICQNKCSGHGSCNTVTRSCMCETFWMPSVFYFWGVEEANCDWSILYVVVAVIVGFLLLSGLFWGISCACRTTAKKPRSRPKVQKYSLLGSQEEELPTPYNRTTSLTDSETDSDVVFETRSKPNGILRSNGAPRNNSHTSKYATTKIGRKIKT